MIPTILVFSINKEYIYGACNLFIMLAFISVGISRFDPLHIFMYVATALVIYNAFNNWYMIERNKSLFGFKRKMAPVSHDYNDQ